MQGFIDREMLPIERQYSSRMCCSILVSFGLIVCTVSSNKSIRKTTVLIYSLTYKYCPF